MVAKGASSAEQAVLAVCRQHPEGVQDTVLQEQCGLSLHHLSTALNALLREKRVQILERQDKPGHYFYKETDEEEAVKQKGLGAEDMLVLQHITQSANGGIWTKDLRNKTNLQQPQINKILRVLEGRSLIKAVKSVASANRKVYMLAELEPARELTGGAWYTDNNFDEEFTRILQQTCMAFIERHADVTLEEVAAYIRSTDLCKVSLKDEEVAMLVNTLQFDGLIDATIADDGEEHYRPAGLAVPDQSAIASMPCGACPVFHDCNDGGPISPATCVYYQKWLEQEF